MAILNSFIIILHIPTIILLIVLRFRQLCYFHNYVIRIVQYLIMQETLNLQTIYI